MNRLVPAGAIASLLLTAPLATAALATSIGSPRPHDASLACMYMSELVADFNEGRPFAAPLKPYRTIYTDELGEVERDEIEAFNTAMLTSEGKRDHKPMSIYSVHTLGGTETDRQYVLTIQRVSWRTKRLEVDGMLQVVEVDDPHWDTHHSFWLVTFESNSLRTVREAGELLHLKPQLERLEDCPLPRFGD